MSPAERAELRRMGERLIALADGNSLGAEEPEYDPLLDAAWQEISRRKARRRALPRKLSSESAWNILLDLFVMQSIGKRVQMTSACIASNAPPTTGLRWVHALIDAEYVVRENDPADGRRTILRLSTLGTTIVADAMRSLLKAEKVPLENYRRRVLGESTSSDVLARECGIRLMTVERHLMNTRSGQIAEQREG